MYLPVVDFVSTKKPHADLTACDTLQAAVSLRRLYLASYASDHVLYQPDKNEAIQRIQKSKKGNPSLYTKATPNAPDALSLSAFTSKHESKHESKPSQAEKHNEALSKIPKTKH